MELVTFATRLCKLLGIQTMLGESLSMSVWSLADSIPLAVTNAAGGLNPDYAVGDIVVLNDVGATSSKLRRSPC